jgi:hypothetical protein
LTKVRSKSSEKIKIPNVNKSSKQSVDSKARPKKIGKPNSTLISHKIMIDGRRTLVRLEKEIWMAIKEISIYEKCTIHQLCTVINKVKKLQGSLSSSIRVF